METLPPLLCPFFFFVLVILRTVLLFSFGLCLLVPPVSSLFFFCFASLFSVLVCPVFLLVSPPLSVFFFLRLCLFFVPPGFPACVCISLCSVYWVFSVFFWISFAGFLPSVLLRFSLVLLCFLPVFSFFPPSFQSNSSLVSVQFVPLVHGLSLAFIAREQNRFFKPSIVIIAGVMVMHRWTSVFLVW